PPRPTPPPSPHMTSKAEAVRAMFTRIARRYDLMNSLMTGGRHHAWRRLTAAAVAGAPAGLALDLATGTGDLALALRAAAPQRPVIGVDFSEAMLREARANCAGRGVRGFRRTGRAGGGHGARGAPRGAVSSPRPRHDRVPRGQRIDVSASVH